MKKTIILIQVTLFFLTLAEAYSQCGWFNQVSGTTNLLRGVSFSDANNRTAVGNYGTILRTTNGGTYWTSQLSGTSNDLGGVSFTDANTGTVVGGYGTILRTTNGGVFVKHINSKIPDRFSLYQNYPNPFNPVTRIAFDIPKSSFVEFVVYNVLGKEVSTIVNEKLSAGRYEVNWNGSDYPSGVYFYRIEAGDFVDVKKMLLIK